MIGAIVLSIGFIMTIVPDDIDPSKKDEANKLNKAWNSGFTNYVTFSYLGFLLAYITTLSILKIRLKKFYPDFYDS
jgi:hypothetical protein